MPFDPTIWDGDGTWDSGLQFDVNVGPTPGDVQPYLDLITSEHDDKPNFLAVLRAILQPIADCIYVLNTIPGKFDIDNAVGDQLDKVGEWIGRTRFLSIPLENTYFSFGIEGLGFGQGTWRGEFDPSGGLVRLPDEAYRTYLRATIAANQWDGTIPGAYAAWAELFAGADFTLIIVDNQDMTMLMGLIGGQPDAVTLALLTGGYLDLKPAGVRITGYITNSVPNTPVFGFGPATDVIGGFGIGSWATTLSPT